jgi:hypothetical protein
MARWTPRTPKESLEASIARIDARIETKKQELKELQDQRKQVEHAVKALTV